MHFGSVKSAEEPRDEVRTRGWQLAVASGILGWVLDAFDFFVVIFLFDTLSARFHVGKAAIVYTLTLTLAMRPLGAFAFGALADRFGRKRPLILCVLYFSAMTVLSGLAPNFAVFALARGLYGFGMGGYWGIGASYAMESAPVRLRGPLSGLMQSGYPMGYLAAAVVMQTVTPYLGWRSVFFLGAPIAVLIALLAWFAPESEAWRVQRASSLRSIVGSLTGHTRIFIYLLVLMSVMICLSHGTQDLYPDFLRSVGGLAHKTIAGMDLVYGIPIFYNIAAVAGALFFGFLSERIGRRHSMLLALGLALISIPAWAFGSTVLALTVGACLMQAGGQGAFGVIPAHMNELSPASVRGIFPGFVYQLGVLVASPATMVELKLRTAFGYPWALTIFESVVIFALIGLYWFGPENHGKSFSEPVDQLSAVVGE